jgi:hypothetical protein
LKAVINNESDDII